MRNRYFEFFKEKLRKTNLDLQNLISVCTDGEPSMKGKHEELGALLQKEPPNPDTLMSFHCVLHQRNLCDKSALVSDTVKGVVGIANYIRANLTQHRLFCQLLQFDDIIM